MKFTKELNREKMELDMVWYNLEITAYFLVSGYDYWLSMSSCYNPLLPILTDMH